MPRTVPPQSWHHTMMISDAAQAAAASPDRLSPSLRVSESQAGLRAGHPGGPGGRASRPRCRLRLRRTDRSPIRTRIGLRLPLGSPALDRAEARAAGGSELLTVRSRWATAGPAGLGPDENHRRARDDNRAFTVQRFTNVLRPNSHGQLALPGSLRGGGRSGFRVLETAFNMARQKFRPYRIVPRSHCHRAGSANLGAATEP